MRRFFQVLQPGIHAVIKFPIQILVTATVLSVVGLAFASQLRIDTDIARLLPDSYPSVQALERLRSAVGSESPIAVIIESPSFEASVAFADTLIPHVFSIEDGETGEPFFVRVEYRKDTHFIEHNALYFATDEELRELEIYLIRQRMRAGSPLPFNTRRSDGDRLPVRLVEAYETIIPPEYPISADSTTLVVRFYANGLQTNIGFVERVYQLLEDEIASLGPGQFHPDMVVSVGGRFERSLVEVRAIRRDVIGSFGGGLTSVLLLVLSYFAFKLYRTRVPKGISWRILLEEVRRMPITAVLIGLPLLMSLSWTFGYARLVYDTLNLMTSTLVLVLFGLGVDYGIHFYARYLEDRGLGHSMAHAITNTFLQAGPAILVSAMTTASALFVLVIADFQGFSQFGVVAGVGVLLAVVAMLYVLPSLIVLGERYGLLPHGIQGIGEEEPVLSAGPKRYPWSRRVVTATAVITIGFLAVAPRAEFEYRFGELEPVFPEFDALRDKEARVYASGRRNPAYVLVDRPEDVPPVTEILRERARTDTLSPTILSIESLQERYPVTPVEQAQRLERLSKIRRLLSDPFLRALGTSDVERLHRAAQTARPIPLDSVPDFLKMQFMSRSGELGDYVIVYPSVGLSDGRRSIEFAEDVGRIELPDGRVYDAASTSIVGAEMLRLLIEEAPWMILLTSIVVLAILLLLFRSVKWTLLAAAPLVIGSIWMVGFVTMTDSRLNFYNLVVIPAMLGIGVDGGVHIVHRFLMEGRGRLRHIMKTTGEHVAIGSLTTLLAFSWWLSSHHPGLNSIGFLAVIGIGSVLLVSLISLPAFLQVMESKHPEAKWLDRAGEEPSSRQVSGPSAHTEELITTETEPGA